MDFFPKIVLDTCYTEQLLKPTDFDDLLTFGKDVQFLVASNKTDLVFREWFPDLRDIFNSITHENYPAKIDLLIAKISSANSCVFLSIRETSCGQVIGFFHFAPTGGLQFYLKEKYRRVGIMNRILDEFILQLKISNWNTIKVIWADVNLKNVPSLSFFTKIGFKENNRNDTWVRFNKEI